MKWVIIFVLLFLPATLLAEIHGFFEFGKALENDYTKA